MEHLGEKSAKDLGKAGESTACRYLQRFGYDILARNYSTPLGEIDIVAQDGDFLVFVEVKTRRNDTYGLPEEAINRKKMHKLTTLAQYYIKSKKIYNKKARFDVVSVIDRGLFRKKSLKLIKNAFYAEE